MTLPGLVVVSPLPPSWTGVADYTARLLPHLTKSWDVTILIDDDDPMPEGDTAEVRIFRVAEWQWAQALVKDERMLLCLGNSTHHSRVPELCRRHGGVVLAHDVRMTALQCLRASKLADPHYLSGIVEERHGPELGRELRALEDRSPLTSGFAEARRRIEEANVFLLGSSVFGADTVCVHSRLAARLARLDIHDRSTPVVTVPFGFPAPATGPRRPVPGRIACFGMVEPEKMPVLLVEALALVRKQIPHASLRFVGTLGTGIVELLQSVGAKVGLGVGEAVSWTDRVDDVTYHSELVSTSVAVQLRAVVNGEASAAVTDCLAEGVPTVVTPVGAIAEIPEAAVSHVPTGVSPYQLAGHLAQLLLDERRQRALSRSARRVAGRSSFARAAEALTDVLRAAPAMRR